MITKECKICSKTFEPTVYNKMCCSPYCSKVNKANIMISYNRTPYVKNMKKLFWDSYKHTDKFKQRRKEYRSMDKYKLYNKEYLKNYSHTDKRKEYIRSYLKEWRKTLMGKTYRNKHHLLRRIGNNNIKEVYTELEWQNKLRETKGICLNCGKYIGIDKLTRDHNPAISKANELYQQTGRKTIYTINDMIPLCAGCNSSKGNRFIMREVTC